MASAPRFVGWKLAELVIWTLGFPFLLIGLWMHEASDWCHDRALEHKPPMRQGSRRCFFINMKD